MTLFKTLGNNVILSEHNIVFLSTTMLKNIMQFFKLKSCLKKSCNFSCLLVFSNNVILRGHIVNVCIRTFLKLISHLLPSYELPYVVLQELHLHPKNVLNQCT